MTIFVLLTDPNNANVRSSVEQNYGPHRYLQVGPGQWLLADSGTAREICEKLGILEENGPIPSAIVFSTIGYWGRHNPTTWEWIAARMKEVPSG